MAFKTHTAHWQALAAAEKEAYEQRALVQQAHSAQQHQEQAKLLQAALVAEKQTRVQKEESAADSMMLSACVLSSQDLQRFEELNSSPAFKGSKGEALHKAALQCPPPMTTQEFQVMQAKSLLDTQTRSTPSSITKQVAHFRQHFCNSVVVVAPDTEQEQHYRFLFASQQPVLAAWLPLVPEDVPDNHGRFSGKNWQQQALTDFSLMWRYQPGLVEIEDLFDDLDAVDVAVALQTSYKAPGIITSHDFLQPLALILDGLTREESLLGKSSKHAEAPKQRAASSSSSAAALPPWAAARLAAASTPASASQSTGVGPEEASQQEPDEAQPVAELADYETVYAQVDAERQQLMDVESDLSAEYFRWSILGGAWSVQRSGRSVYGVRVDIRAQSPLLGFARLVNLTQSASFDNHTYSAEGGRLLASLWTQRMVQLYEAWLVSGEATTWSGAEVPDLELFASQTALADGLSRRGRARLQRIRALKP